MKRPSRLLWLIAGLLTVLSAHAEDVTVFAAASLSNALKDIGGVYQARFKDSRIRASFAASSTLAKQIEAGAPADVFMSADRKWMDYLADRNLIIKASRKDMLGNTLVLIAPASEAKSFAMLEGKPPELNGRLCMGEPASVPAGIYGKQALTNLRWWSTLEKQIVATEDVRTALSFVERAECPLGIVYETDARISNKVTVVGRFPAATHDPIVYPFALLPAAGNAARQFFKYLAEPEARAIFQKYGFVMLNP